MNHGNMLFALVVAAGVLVALWAIFGRAILEALR